MSFFLLVRSFVRVAQDAEMMRADEGQGRQEGRQHGDATRVMMDLDLNLLKNEANYF